MKTPLIKTTSIAALAILVMVAAASTASAGSGSIQGVVTDDQSGLDPLAGISVCFVELQGATEEACTPTDGSGHYLLAGLSPGSYVVSFRAPQGVNLITQYYNDQLTYPNAEPIAVGTGAVTGIDAQMHEGGTIEGTATAAGSGTPVAGLSVCAEANGGLYSGCTATDSAGHYVIAGLPSAPDYQVEFSPGSELNYLRQFFQGKEGLDNWDPVDVAIGEVTPEIDAVMNPGAQIAGHVSEAGTGAFLEGIEVCALDPTGTPRAEEFERCASTDASGNYTLRSLPAGTYVVVFARFGSPVAGGIEAQYYNGVASEADAMRITLAPPSIRSRIDASLVTAREKARIEPVPRSVCVVPRLRFRRIAAARRQLVASHCGVGKVAHRTTRRVNRRRVLRQSARAGTAMPLGTPVDLVVGRFAPKKVGARN